MEMIFHNDNECYLLFKKMRSYDEMLDAMIMSTRIQDMSKKEKNPNNGLTLDEIMKSLDIRKWSDSDGKN